MNDELFLSIGGLTLLLVVAWGVAARLGPDWLKPAHGPLWYGAAALTALAGVTLSLLASQNVLVRLVLWLTHRDAFQALVRALLVLVGLFVLGRLLLALLYRPERTRPPVPRAFVITGIAPDGSPLAGFRWLVSRHAALVLLVLLLLTRRSEFVAIGDGATTWAFLYAAILGCFFGSTHPVAPPGPAPTRDDPPASGTARSVDDRLERIHRWLGRPPERERLPAVASSLGAEASSPGNGGRLGLCPYGFQILLSEQTRPGHAVAIAGPEGSGRTTACLARAVELALDQGSATLVLTPDRLTATRTLAAAHALLERISSGAAVGLDGTARLSPCDIWVVSLDDVRDFLAATVNPSANPFFARLGLLVVEDVERLSGPSVVLARFVVHRLRAACGADPALVVTGHVAPAVLAEIGRRIVAGELVMLSSAGGADPQGASSRAVRRYLVDPGKVAHGETATSGLRGIRDGFVRLVEESRGEEEPLPAEVMGGPWAPYPSGDSSTAAPTQVVLAHIGPRTAWRVLGARRYYAGAGSDAREYLLFGEDPLAQRLQENFRQGGSPWPAWYNRKRFPRLLSAVPGASDVPEGLVRHAREELRAALDEGYQEVSRLRAVFGPQTVDAELGTIAGTRLFEQLESWQPDPATPERARIRRLCRAPGRASAASRGDALRMAELHDPSVGTTFHVPAVLLDHSYYPNAVFERDGVRYRVDPDVRGAGPGRRLVRKDPSMAVWTPVRRLHCVPHGREPLAEMRVRFRGLTELVTLRGDIRIEIRHEGARCFEHPEDSNAVPLAGKGFDRGFFHGLPHPIVSKDLVTRAWIVCLPDASEAVLHTLAHVIREIIDYFFVGASSFIGITYEQSFGERAGIVLYDLHPEGLGCLDDIDDRDDLGAILEAARQILSSCTCEAACPRCGHSTSCSLETHNVGLDRRATFAALEALLARPAPAGGGR